MIRKILLMGDPLLTRISEKITDFSTDELSAWVRDLRETQHAHQTLGLSAPQIGINKQIIVLGTEKTAADPNAVDYVPCITLINPHLELLSRNSDEAIEDCLCIPHMHAKIPRFTQIRYFGFDEAGNSIETEAFGHHARLVQHHADHIFRTLYTMRIRDFTKFVFDPAYRAQLSPSES